VIEEVVMDERYEEHKIDSAEGRKIQRTRKKDHQLGVFAVAAVAVVVVAQGGREEWAEGTEEA